MPGIIGGGGGGGGGGSHGTGSVLQHGDVLDVGSGRIISAAERIQITTNATNIDSNTTSIGANSIHRVASGNPHGLSIGDIGAEAAGTAATVLANHEAAANPHAAYAPVIEISQAAYDALSPPVSGTLYVITS